MRWGWTRVWGMLLLVVWLITHNESVIVDHSVRQKGTSLACLQSLPAFSFEGLIRDRQMRSRADSEW